MASKVSVNYSDLSCPICLEIYEDPRCLPCLHSFCLACLEEWGKKSGATRSIACPLCKQLSQMPLGGTRKIKTNFFLADLVLRLASRDIKSGAKCKTPCSTESCDESAVQYCTQGCGHLCPDCIRYHRRSAATKNHDIVHVDLATAREEDKIILDEIYCKFHPRNIVDQFCKDCNLAACSTCLLRDHRNHTLGVLNEQGEGSKQDLRDVLKQADVLSKLIDDKMVDTMRYDKKSTEDINNVKTQIDNVVDGMIDRLNNQRKQLLTSLNQLHDDKEKVVRTVSDDQKNQKVAVDSFVSYTDNLLKHGRDYDQVLQMKDVHSRLAAVSTVKIPSFVWVYQKKGVSSLQRDMPVASVDVKTVIDSKDVIQKKTYDVTSEKALGDVMVDAIQEGGPDKDGKMTTVSREGILSESERTTVTKRVLKDGSVVAGMVLMDGYMWVVHWGQSALYAYPINSPSQPPSRYIVEPIDPTNVEPQTIPIRGLSDPASIVEFPPGQTHLVISDWKKRELQWIQLELRHNMWSVVVQRSLSVVYPPLGLGVSDNQLLVCDGEVIHVLSTSGKEIKIVSPPQTVSPWKAIPQPTAPGFVIMDRNEKQVVLLSEKGQLQQTYRGQQWFDPRDIICYARSTYISDWSNDSVDQLDGDGWQMRPLINRKHGVWRPHSLGVDQLGQIYVGHGLSNKKHVWSIKALVPSDETTAATQLLTQQTVMELTLTWHN